MHVSIVGKPLSLPLPVKFMKDLTLERNPMNANTVVKPLHVTAPFEDMEKRIPKEKPLCMQTNMQEC